jgi:hypothetical protein
VLRLPWRNNPLLIGGVAMALGLHVAAMHAPLLQRTLAVHPPTAEEWFVLPLLALTLLFIMEAQKVWLRGQRH